MLIRLMLTAAGDPVPGCLTSMADGDAPGGVPPVRTPISRYSDVQPVDDNAWIVCRARKAA
eukprot:SAG31_NODE_20987_length_560_cov_1.047722_2_plen_61_part_01